MLAQRSGTVRWILAAVATVSLLIPASAQQTKQPPKPAPTRPPAKPSQPSTPKPAPAVTPAPPQPAPPPPPEIVVVTEYVAGDKKTNSTISGNGKRQRIDYGNEMTVITQCDAGRLIQINETQKRFLAMPLTQAPAAAQSDATKGGVVTYSSSVVDTGDRKEMFGLTARHLITTLSKEPDAKACDRRKEQVVTDGWFVDPPAALACAAAPERRQFVATAADCRDEIKYVDAAGAAPGYPLSYTTTTTGADGKSSALTMAVTALDRQTLPAELFEAPAGHAEVTTLAQLTAGPGTLPRIGVAPVTSGVKDSIPLDVLSDAIAVSLNEAGMEAALVDAPAPATGDRSRDYVLTIRVVDINKPAKGVLGRVTGSKEYGARVEYSLIPAGGGKPRLSGSERSGASGLRTAVTTARNVSRFMTPLGLLGSQFNFMSTFGALTGGASGPAVSESSDPVLNTVFFLLGTGSPKKAEGEQPESETGAVAAAMEKVVAAVAAELLEKH